MDFRRSFGLREPVSIKDSTILVPQLENYSLFATPFLDLSKKFDKLNEVQRDVKGQSEEDAPGKRVTRQEGKSNEQEEVGGQTVSNETSQVDVNFGIVLNVVTVKPEQLTITFKKDNEIEVKVLQDSEVLEYGNIPFKRNCTYKYKLPDDVDKNSLVALRTSDDYLIILPRDHVREDLLNKSIMATEEVAESSSEDPSPLKETTEGKDLDEKAKSEPGPTKSKEKKLKSTDDNEKTKPQVSGKDADDREMDSVFPVVQVTRMLRPGLDIFMLRKYMADLESYVSTARKFVENASFVSLNSKTAERCIRHLAKTEAGKGFKEPNLKSNIRRMRKEIEPSPDSGYTSASGASDANASESDPKTSGTTDKSKTELDDIVSETSDENTRGSGAIVSEIADENTRGSSAVSEISDENTRGSSATGYEASDENTRGFEAKDSKTPEKKPESVKEKSPMLKILLEASPKNPSETGGSPKFGSLEETPQKK